MKQQPCATSLPPSRLCRLLIIAFALKLVVLGMLILDPGVGGIGTGNWFSDPDTFGRGVAHAAAADSGASAGAPPALAPVAQGQREQIPPTLTPSMPTGGASGDPSRSLPAIGQRPANMAGGVGAAPGADGSGATGSGATPGGDASLAPDAREAMTRKQEDLARKEQELRALEAELSGRLEKMRMLENRLASMIKDAKDTNDAKFRHLVDVLSNMKTKQAAAVLETLDKKIAVKVLAGMRGRQAGEILTFVRPEVAAHLTEALARMQLPLE